MQPEGKRVNREELIHAGESLKLLQHLAREEAKLYQKGAKGVDEVLCETKSTKAAAEVIPAKPKA